MAALKMSLLACAVGFLGVFAQGALSVDAYSKHPAAETHISHPLTSFTADSTHTETIGAQEIGSTTSDGTSPSPLLRRRTHLMPTGFLIYSVNYCTIIHTTACDVSISTGGPVFTPEPPSGAASTSSSAAATDEPAPPASYGSVVAPSASLEPGASDGWTPVPAPTDYSGGGGDEGTATDTPSASATDAGETSATGSESISSSESAKGVSTGTATDEATGSGTGTKTGGATTTGTNAAVVLDSIPAAVLGAAGMALAYLL